MADEARFVVQDDHAKQGKFGFPVDNTIGGNPQPNGWMDSWVEFYRERRLRHMLRLVNDSRLTDMGERVAKNLDKMFDGVKVSFRNLPSTATPSGRCQGPPLACRGWEPSLEQAFMCTAYCWCMCR